MGRTISARARAGVVAVAVVGSALLAGNTSAVTGSAAGSSGTHRQIAASGTGHFAAKPNGSGALAYPEFRPQSTDGGVGAYRGPINDRSHSKGQGAGGQASNDRRIIRNPKLAASFDGLYHRQQRLANGGNQFSVEPPDQGLCVGNGQVLESVNDVTRVYDQAGNPLTGVSDLNTFYGYPPAIVRPRGPYGQFVTDPSCTFDPQTQRWFMTVLTLETVPADGSFTGDNHIDLAVSQTPDATQGWTIYSFSANDDGSNGTPNHGCTNPGSPTGKGQCFGDYPHIGSDANGFYITTNEYSFFGPEFHGAQIYALNKSQLASNGATVDLAQFDTHGLDNGNSGFTIWPSISTGGNGAVADAAGGTEFFMSSNAADEAHGDGINPGPRTSDQLLVWGVTNTGSFTTGPPNLQLVHTTLRVNRYGTPPPSDQRDGQAPLRDCLNSPDCSNFLNGGPDPFAPETTAAPDSNDTRMQQVTLAHGQLWGGLDTALTIGGVNKAGIEYFIVAPSFRNGSLRARIDRQGYVGLEGNNLTYPTIGVTPAGHAVMGFTLLGRDYFPSAGYVALEASAGTGQIRVAAAGKGPQDGFSGYKFYGNPPGTKRPRWGDYGAAAVDGNDIWIANEYIGQTCDLATYRSAPFGSCGGTRTALANWDTRISKFQVGP